MVMKYSHFPSFYINLVKLRFFELNTSFKDSKVVGTSTCKSTLEMLASGIIAVYKCGSLGLRCYSNQIWAWLTEKRRRSMKTFQSDHQAVSSHLWLILKKRWKYSRLFLRASTIVAWLKIGETRQTRKRRNMLLPSLAAVPSLQVPAQFVARQWDWPSNPSRNLASYVRRWVMHISRLLTICSKCMICIITQLITCTWKYTIFVCTVYRKLFPSAICMYLVYSNVLASVINHNYIQKMRVQWDRSGNAANRGPGFLVKLDTSVAGCSSTQNVFSDCIMMYYVGL